MQTKTLLFTLLAGAAVASPAAQPEVQARQVTDPALSSALAEATSLLGALTSVPTQFTSVVSALAAITPPPDLVPAYLSIVGANTGNPCALQTLQASAFPSSLRSEASSYLNAQRSFYQQNSAAVISYANYIASVFSTTVDTVCTNIPAGNGGSSSGSGSASGTATTTRTGSATTTGTASRSGSTSGTATGTGVASASGNGAPRQTGFAIAGAAVAGVLGLVAAL